MPLVYLPEEESFEYPRGLNREQRRLLNQVNDVCNEVTAETEVDFSIHSQVLIFNALDAMRRDPSPQWAGDYERSVNSIYEDLSGVLGPYLTQLAESEADYEKVTYFQTLHWLTGRLNVICPIRKE
jgi:hypothetical protein